VTAGHNEPILAIDFGMRYSAAYLVPPRSGEPIPVGEGRASRWPSAVLAAADGSLRVGTEAESQRKDAPQESFASEFKRDLGNPDPIIGPHAPADLVRRMIEAMADKAGEQAGGRSRLGRTVLTVPESYRDPVNYETPFTLRGLMVSAAEQAGLHPIELLPEPVAAAWGLRHRLPKGGPRLVLVYDFGGGTFDTALVQFNPGDEPPRVLGTDSERVGGTDIDRDLAGLLEQKLAAQHGDWLRATLGPGRAADEKTRRYRFNVNAQAEAERLKIQLTTSKTDVGRVLGSAPVEVTQAELHQKARGRIATTIRCYRRLLAKADKKVEDLSVVLLVGGTTKMPLVRELVEADLGDGLAPGQGPRIEDYGLNVDLAVAHGAALWAVDHPINSLAPLPPRSGGSLLRWQLTDPAWPDHGAPSLMRWRTEPGHDYAAGHPLARVRYPDGSLWDLAARHAGTLGQLLTAPDGSDEAADAGAAIRSARQWLATTEGDGDHAHL
jgi:molecular chaperone DnaK